MNNIQEVVEIFKKAQPYRRPVKYARVGDKWFIYSENTANGGKNLPLIENGWFYVQGNKVLPTTPMSMPKDISMITVPAIYQKPYTPKP